MKENEILVRVLDDGRVVIETSRFAAKDHVTAERFMAELPRVLGATELKITRRQHSHHHHHHQHHGISGGHGHGGHDHQH